MGFPIYLIKYIGPETGMQHDSPRMLRTTGRTAFARIAGLVVLLLLLGTAPARAARPLVVFAAASLSGPLDQVAAAYHKDGGDAVKLSYASSSTLAKQIAAGAPADVYVSANIAWMDYVQHAGRLVPGTRFDWLGNDIVVVVPSGHAAALAGEPLVQVLSRGRIAMGDPDHVPAGIYGKQSLQSLGLWKTVAPRVARADNVRAALALVARGEVPLGIVYATDAALEPGVEVAAALPADSHKPIIYPAAVVKSDDTAAARKLLAFLRTPDAARIMLAAGFRVLAK